MTEKLIERRNTAIPHIPIGARTVSNDKVVSDKALFGQLGSKLKVVKRGD